MRICSMASGSSGNCVYVGSGNTNLLVDVGISRKRVEEGLDRLGVSGEQLSAILITHEHSDHVKGLGVFCRKYGIPVYATAGTISGILSGAGGDKVPEGLFNEIEKDRPFAVGELSVKAFSLSHDANDPTGYRIESGDRAFAVATDLGVYDEYIIDNLKGLNAVLLEANHDVHMLEVGSYPYPLKQRVLGEKGHLSNESSGRLLCRILNGNLKYVMLGHLSDENNFGELAYETVRLEVELGDTPFKEDGFRIVVAERDKMSEILEI